MEGGDGAHAFDLVDVTPRLDEPLAKHGHAWTITEQKQAMRPSEDDVAARDVGAGRTVLFAEASPRRVDARQGCAVGLIRQDADCLEHALGEAPGIAADGLIGSSILCRRRIAEKHERRLLRTVGEDPSRAWPRHWNPSARRQPFLKLCKRGRQRLRCQLRLGNDFRFPGARCNRLQPVARILLDGDVDAGLQPPG